MKKSKVPKKLLDKRIPTVAGLFVLVIALIAGTLLIGTGGGVFSPRATPTTTPKLIKVTNVTDTSFTISFLTDDLTTGFVKYGDSSSSLNSQAGDDRDQLSGTVGEFNTHHITVRGLSPTKTYFYTIGTGSRANFDNAGIPFTIKTAARNGAPAAAKTIYGSVSNKAGNPADGAIVYVTVANAGDMSSQVKKTGSWAVPLSNARTKDGSNYAAIVDEDTILVTAQGNLPTQKASATTTVINAQPVPEMTFGQETEVAIAPTTIPLSTPPVVDDAMKKTTSEIPDAEAGLIDAMANIADPEASESARDEFLSDLLSDLDEVDTKDGSASAEITILDLDVETPQELTTGMPLIKGMALPNVIVSIEIHSDTEIIQDIVADENGEFELNIAALSENLEPGDHTVTYSYTDPKSGEIVEKTVNFTVAPPQLADASEPYGSGNPYPLTSESATESAEASMSATATESASASQSAKTSIPATDEAIPVSGSVSTTLALVFGGLFFITAGLWSFWISSQLRKGDLEL